MPFGLCTTPATFHELMDHCMRDHNLRECLICFDDIIVFSSTGDGHLGD